MSAPYYGMGTLQLNRGIDLPRSTMSLTVDSRSESPVSEVRLTLRDFLPGGCSMQIALSNEAAASLAREISALAQNGASLPPSAPDSVQPSFHLALTA